MDGGERLWEQGGGTPWARLVPAHVPQVSQLSHTNQIEKILTEPVRLQRAGMQRQSLLNTVLSEDAGWFFPWKGNKPYTPNLYPERKYVYRCLFFLTVICTSATEVCPDATLVRHHELPFTLRYTGLASGTTKGLKKNKSVCLASRWTAVLSGCQNSDFMW